jgi:hypothetical protein
LQPSDIDIIAKNWWNMFGKYEIKRAKKEVAIQRNLARFYKQMSKASKKDWETYVKLKILARMKSPAMQKALELMLSPSRL